jgi:hypothetical protein
MIVWVVSVSSVAVGLVDFISQPTRRKDTARSNLIDEKTARWNVN